MGAVACEKRGTHPGMFSCDHLRFPLKGIN
jgi:hypothetical protein